jgi:hypothetical protein
MKLLFYPALAGLRRCAQLLERLYISATTVTATSNRHTVKTGQPKESPSLVGKSHLAGLWLALLALPIRAPFVACRRVVSYWCALVLYRLWGVIHVDYSTHGGAGFVLVRYSFLTAHRVNQVLDALPLYAPVHIKRGGTVWCVATLIAAPLDALQASERLRHETHSAAPVPPYNLSCAVVGALTLVLFALLVCASIAVGVFHA